MVSNANEQVRSALAKVLGGDPFSMALIKPIEHAVLRDAAASLSEPLVLSRRALVSVLLGLNQGVFPPELVHSWASFVRRGYLAPSFGGPIAPLDIEYEEAWEDAMVEAVARLDEIGDIIDGDVTSEEALDLIQLLGRL